MAEKVEAYNIESIEESANNHSPWQLAKKITGEFPGMHSEFRSFADDGYIEAWLESEV